MHVIDWSIVLALWVSLVIGALLTRKYVQSVADFLAANRCAGRYLISIASIAAGFSTLSFIGYFEAYQQAGFTPTWWQLLAIIQLTIVGLAGWVVYRYRQTRVLTFGQFLEIRYSKRLRIFAGILAWIAGVINFGIFPVVGARFFIYYCDFPDNYFVLSSIMLILIGISLFFAFLGGHIAVMVSDFLVGVFNNVVLIAIMVFLFFHFSWSQVIESLTSSGKVDSMINPFSSNQVQDFNVWFYLIVAFINFYGTGVWQSMQGYNACALNAHEARMSGVIGGWRWPGSFLAIMLMAICAYTLLHHPDFSAMSGKVNDALSVIGNPTIRRQVTTTVALRHLLPVGLNGAFAAVMFGAFIASHNMLLCSWGSMFIQDIVLPFRKTPFAPQQHMILLRISIAMVAVLVFFLGLLLRQTEFVHMFYMISASIFVSGAGSLMIGGLYWKKGTARGAWCALIIGASLALSWIVIRQINSVSPFISPFMKFLVSQKPGTMSFFNAVVALSTYTTVSLLSRKPAFDMDRLLHRGGYKVQEAEDETMAEGMAKWRKWIGMGKTFTLMKDKITYLASMGLTATMGLTFIGGTVYTLCCSAAPVFWGILWRDFIIIVFVLTVVVCVWFTIGGFRDLRHMFKLLTTLKRNHLDDGMVVDHHSLGEKN
jgi:solute:Na+ symporter, SSS family